MKKYNKILNVLMTAGSIFMFVGYFIYLVKLFIWSEGTLPYVIAFAVCILLPAVLVLDRTGTLKKLFRRAYVPLKTIYTFALVFYTVTFLFLCAYIFGGSVSETPVADLPENTIVLTLGAKVERDGNPGKILRKRLDTTAKMLSERKDLTCIVSGGKGKDEPISEAECMMKYLVGKGIDAPRIAMEPESHNTIENIKNTMKILDELEKLGKEPSVAVVTTNFHVPRAKILCARLGMDMEKTYFYNAPDTGKFLLYPTLVREYMSYCKLIIFGI